MRRIIFFGLFALLYVAQILQLDLSLAPGLSLKNAFLYCILVWIALQYAVTWRDPGLALPYDVKVVIFVFCLYFTYAALSWMATAFVVEPRGYRMLNKLIALKSNLADHLFIFVCFLLGVRTLDDAVSLMRWLVLLLILGNVITIMDAYDMPDLNIIHQRDDTRVSGTLGESNQYAAFLVMLLPMMFAMAFGERGIMRVVLVLGSGISAAGLLLAASRGAIVGLVVGSVVTIIYLRHYIRFELVAKAVLLVVVFAILLVVALSPEYGTLMSDRFIESTQNSNLDSASSGRIEFWTRALGLQWDRPWTLIVGYGWEMYGVMIKGYGIHNTYLAIFFNLGALGLFLYLILLFGIVSVIRKSLTAAHGPSRRFLIAFVFGFLSMSVAVFFVNLYQAWIFIWALVGLVTRIAVEVRHTSTETMTGQPVLAPA